MIKSILSDKTEIRSSTICGKGTFAKEDIKKSENDIYPWWSLLTKDKAFCYGTIDGVWPITDKEFLGALTEEEFPMQKVYVNHSCDANCGIRGEITVVAMRDIKKGEEITQDYGLLYNEDYSFKCNCGSKNCRGLLQIRLENKRTTK
jgi:hypothetical protein